MSFRHLKVADEVNRNLGGVLMPMIVTEVKEDTVICDTITKDGAIFLGPWTFDRDTGWEEDSKLRWGNAYGRTGSYLIKE